MRYEQALKPVGSSGVAKAGMITGISALALTALNGGALPLFGGQRVVAAGSPAGVVIENTNVGYVSKEEARLQSVISSKDDEIVKLSSEKYAADCVNTALAPVYAMLNAQGQEICALKADAAMESERRACGDEKLLSYVNGNFIKAEKSINSKHINYHGVRPVLETDDCCERAC